MERAIKSAVTSQITASMDTEEGPRLSVEIIKQSELHRTSITWGIFGEES